MTFVEIYEELWKETLESKQQNTISIKSRHIYISFEFAQYIDFYVKLDRNNKNWIPIGPFIISMYVDWYILVRQFLKYILVYNSWNFLYNTIKEYTKSLGTYSWPDNPSKFNDFTRNSNCRMKLNDDVFRVQIYMIYIQI